MTKKFVLALAIFITVSTTSTVFAQASLDYYKKLFNSWGIKLDLLSQETVEQNTPTEDTSDSEITILEKTKTSLTPKNPYLLLLASQLQTLSQENLQITAYQKIIVICNSKEIENLNQKDYCELATSNLLELDHNETTTSAKIFQTIKPIEINNAGYYFLPQTLLINPQYQETLEKYFKALARAQQTDTKEIKEKLNIPPLKKSLSEIRNSTLLESTLYAASLLLFVVIFRRALLTSIHNPNAFLRKDLYLLQIQNALNFLTKNSALLKFSFLILAVFYIPILYTLNVKATMVGDASYPIKYLTSTMNPLNIPNYLIAQNFFRLGLLFYNYVLALFGVFIMIPNLASIFTTSAKKIAQAKFSANFLKWAIPITITTIGLLLAFADIKSILGLLSIGLLVLLASLYYLRVKKLNYAKLFTPKQRNLVILALNTVLILNIAYPLFQKSHPASYEYEPLIGLKDEIIALPYSKQWGKNVLFEPHYYTGNSKVYADSYLIYVPNSKQIVNRRLADFTNNQSFSVTSSKNTNISGLLLKNEQLLNQLVTPDFSPIFTVTNFTADKLATPFLTAQLTFNCNLNPPSAEIKLEAQTLSIFAENEKDNDYIATETTKLMLFPGCNTEAALETFEVPFDTYAIPEKASILRLRGIDQKYVAGLKIIQNQQELPIKFVSKELLNETQLSILKTSVNQADTFYNYSAGIKKDITVNIKNTPQGFDLSEPINELIKAGALKNPFLIWTDKPNELIENYDTE